MIRSARNNLKLSEILSRLVNYYDLWIFSGETENSRITLNDSEVIVEIMDNARKQLGVVYDVD